MKKYRSLIVKGSIIVFLIIVLIILSVLKNNKDIAESWTRSFGYGYGRVMSTLTSWIPVSITELFFVGLFIGIITLFVMFIVDLVRHNFIKSFNTLIYIPLLILMVIVDYSLSCEFAYNRQPVDLPYYENEVENKEFKDIYNYFADDLNYCISQLDIKEDGDLDVHYSFDDVVSMIKDEFNKQIISDYFYDFNVTPKRMMSSFLYTALQISGVTFNSFSEANVNIMTPTVQIPFVIAHEMCHTKGVMREDEANQVAFYLLLNSEVIYFRFSAYVLYFSQIRTLSSSYYINDEDRAILTSIDKKYSLAVKYKNDFWEHHDFLGNIGDFFNNLYIKSSGVNSGVESYQGGTQIIVDPYTHKLTPSKYQKLFFNKYFLNKENDGL